jgi:EmrB/QacA subfamily drug resistance transporter
MNRSRLGMTAAQAWVLALTSVASLMVALDALVVSTALSTIRVHLHASLEDLEWTVNAYVLSLAVLLMTGAALGDRLGRRRMFAAGMGLFTAASAACALARNIGWLIAARAVQGAGAAVMLPLALALLSAAFPPGQRPRALGIFGAVTGLGGVLGPLVGGAVVQGLSWPWIFWVNVPIGLATIAFTRARIGESFGPDAALDLPGLLLVTGGVFGVVWALVRGNPAGWGSTEVIGALAGGVALVAAFVAWELRARSPMLPMRLFGSRAFSSGNAAIFFLWGSGLGIVFFLAQFLQIGLHYTPLAAGVRLMPWGATVIVAAPVAGGRIRRAGERPFLTGGLLLVAAGGAWLALAAGPDLAYWQLLVPLVLTGLGFSAAIPAAQSSVMSHVAPQHIGKASGTFTMLRQLGGAFGIAVAVAVFTRSGSYASAQAFSDGFGPALGICAAIALAGAVAGLLAPARRGTSRPAVAAAGTVSRLQAGAETPEASTMEYGHPGVPHTADTTGTTRSGRTAGEPLRQLSKGQIHDHDPVQH